MKKIYALAGALALVSGMFAQNKVYHDKVVAKMDNKIAISTNLAKPAIAAAGDTVGWNTEVTDFLPEIFKSGQPYIYGYLGGGYIFGKNVDSLNYCAQGHLNINNTPLVITKALVWVRFKNIDAGNTGNAASKITVELWDMANNKAINTAPGNPGFALNSKGPNTKKASVDVTWANIDTSSASILLTEAAFTSPVTITGDFAIAVNSQGLKDGDTLCIMADKVGDAANLDYAFHKRAVPNSTSVSANWLVSDLLFSDPAAGGTGAMDVSIAMFAVLGNGTAVNEFVNGAKLNAIYPNPTADMATITYALENDSKNVNLVIFDSKGSVVKSENFGNQVKGEYKTTFDVSNLAAGSYYYQLMSNGYKITKELVVTK